MFRPVHSNRYASNVPSLLITDGQTEKLMEVTGWNLTFALH